MQRMVGTTTTSEARTEEKRAAVILGFRRESQAKPEHTRTTFFTTSSSSSSSSQSSCVNGKAPCYNKLSTRRRQPDLEYTHTINPSGESGRNYRQVHPGY
ncbi:hypothetical protein CBR_g38375 [Chara braunii]|uniref:Uncharacterized protein n=1 Tax=Chara braunii TaxID=69332 RepID=A0A388JNF2_CHABU|nr:hypothetical protein CBR_g38375 [Chara braunii]|eukprot:GBG59346.1 hypothetical protein CBR_g38375 [Chara braunii]